MRPKRTVTKRRVTRRTVTKRTATKRTVWRASIGALAVVGVLIFGAWLTTSSAAAQPGIVTGPIAHQPAPAAGAPGGGAPPAGASLAPTAPEGSPAIRPSASQSKTGSAPSANGGASITKGEVIAYVQTHHMPRMSAPAQPFVVTRAELVRSDVITTLLHGEIIGTPDDQLLWYVEVNGTFTASGPSDAPVLTFHHGVWVFDPTTGNLLLYGGHP